MLKFNEIKEKFRSNKNNIMKRIATWIGLSIIVTIIIEGLQRASIIKASTFIATHFSMFMLNLGIVLSVTSIAFLFKKRKAMFTLISGLLLIFAIIGFMLKKFRGSPFTPADIYSIKDGMSMAKEYVGPIEVILGLLALVGFIGIIIVLFKKEKKQENYNILKNLAIFIIPAFIFTAGYYKYNKAEGNIKYYRWDLNATYSENGYLVSFINSAKELIPNKPDSYTTERMADLKTGLEEASAEVSGNKKKPNIIIVQLESFVDPYRIKGVEFTKDPMPNIRKLQEMGPNGLIRVPSFGGGTVRTEFEVLTGYSANNLGPGEIPNNTVLKKQAVESMAQILKKQGYGVTAVHNYLGNFYNRDTVYSSFGFDNLVTQEYIDDLQYTYDYPSDMNNLESIKKVLKRDTPQFIFNVAVESHGPYDSDYKAENGYEVSGDISNEERNQIQEYLDKAFEVDKYVGELIKYVEESGEPTVIAMYGDHLPALGVINDKENFPQNQKYDAEYFIWSNTGIEPKEQDIQAYQLSTYVLDVAGVDGGIMPTFHKTYSNDEKYEEYLKDIQFDQLYGENYLLGDDLYQRSDMKLGLEPVKIKKAYIEGKNLIIDGENLTKASKIIINGKTIQTTYESANRIVGKGFKSDVQAVQVGQEGQYSKILSKTDEVNISK